jgi:hypothetical protein
MRPKERCSLPSRRGNSTAPGGPVNVDGEGRRRWGSTRPLSALLRSASEVWIGLRADPTIVAGFACALAKARAVVLAA